MERDVRNIKNQIREIKRNFIKYKKVFTKKIKVEYIEFKVIAHWFMADKQRAAAIHTEYRNELKTQDIKLNGR